MIEENIGTKDGFRQKSGGGSGIIELLLRECKPADGVRCFGEQSETFIQCFDGEIGRRGSDARTAARGTVKGRRQTDSEKNTEAGGEESETSGVLRLQWRETMGSNPSIDGR